MEQVTKKDFDALKKEHENLKKSHMNLLKNLSKLTDALRGLIDTERGAKRYGEKTVSERMKNYYLIVNDVYLNISKLKY
jgi:hypothetical protein